MTQANQLDALIYIGKIQVQLLVQIKNLLQDTEGELMASIAEVQSAVDAETEVVGSVVTLLDGLSQQLADAIASADPAAVQAVLDDVNANKDALAAAVAAHTVAAPAA